VWRTECIDCVTAWTAVEFPEYGPRAGRRGFSFLQNAEDGSRSPSSLVFKGYRDFFPGVKRLGRESC
jgi:hypothetical protein